MAPGGSFPIQNGNLFPFFSCSNCSCPLELTFDQLDNSALKSILTYLGHHLLQVSDK